MSRTQQTQNYVQNTVNTNLSFKSNDGEQAHRSSKTGIMMTAYMYIELSYLCVQHYVQNNTLSSLYNYVLIINVADKYLF